MPEYTLHTYFRSSCSARLRIALDHKDLPWEARHVNLLKGEQHSDAHRALNPSCSVPLLVVNNPNDDTPPFAIGQSLAALEYLEEAHPETTPLLPPASSPRRRAAARALAAIIACDIQPVTNLRIMKRVRAFDGASAEDWNRDLMTEGLAAYEALARDSAGAYSVGDDLTLADACLAPALWNAQRFGVDLAAFPTISRIMRNLEEHPAVIKAHWKNQPDTPEDLRK
ncbi:hypothetical protein N3K66_001680 [Trichothecium roseum]|uniref:Uncharacterized protein n=1 Tax=Trichothecium roseum TaxID=47278 RepID=A0ACC0V981_9HYPO|nr:hypothetical protein N3K66_001680 [Trichothecium roseum]